MMLVLAGCSGESPESSLAGMRDAASTRSSGPSLASLPAARAGGTAIANAPDRGALVNYTNKGVASRKEGAFTYYPVAISEEHALKAVVTGEMTVPSPDGSQVKLRYERHEEHVDGNWTWVGRVIDGDQMQEALITFGEKAVFGSIPQANGAPPLELVTRGGQLFATVVDPSKAARAFSEDGDTLIPPSAASRAMASAAATQSAVAQNAVAAAAAPPTSANTIDLAIGYSNGLAARIGSDAGAVTRVTNLVQVANQALSNSDINGYFRLVRAVKISYTDTTTNSDTLQKLTGNTGSAAVAVPAALAPLRAARDEYGADLAVLVRDFKTPENDGCGIAWLNGANRTAINPNVDDDWGYAVVSDGEDQGTDGKTYFCAAETLVHEVAHLMGSAHDRANSRDNSNNLQYGAFDYSFGYKTNSANGNFYTVMAYGDTGQTPYRIFSTPLKSTCGGRACGVANSEDNARSLNQTIPIVATFRATVVPFPGRAVSDFDGDGRSDILWRRPNSGAHLIWSAANSNTKVAMATLATEWALVGLGDFDGDGRTDVLFRKASTAENVYWRGGNSTSAVTLGKLSSAWIVAGIGDFNGDGRADILWRNPATGANLIWRSGTTVAAVTSMTGYNVAGIGDFDGDGQSDILWRSASGANVIWRSADSTKVINVGAANPNVFTMAGIGDFDGDGRSDILWRNRSTGGNVIWPSALSASARSIGSSSWNVAAVADYNGDGKSDILWRNNSTGVNMIWYSGDSNTRKAAGSTGVDWIIIAK
ncbi:FG-GAP-like repeat-containing protein [Pseudoxanthomonas putridarboris]|uniref:FG-GAP-like repeat-containing protein n=1 Tax=Pseudoxanthomonas putridarboris TaxID=752605 RepID=A0ABU9J6B2_9GAMM